MDLDESRGVAQLSIRLDDELGERLLFADSTILQDKDQFQELFRGFYLGTDPVTYLSREPGGIYSLFGSSSNRHHTGRALPINGHSRNGYRQSTR